MPCAPPAAPPQRVVASFGDEPFEIPEILRFLPGLSLLSPPDAYPHRPELMVTFDAGSIDRLGILAGHASRADQLIVIDHHASNTRFGTVNLIDPAAAATAMLVLDLIDAAGVGLTRDIAFGLYAGLVADTGSFKYSATTPAVHQAAARLLGTGIEPGMVARELWDRAPFGYLGLLSAALGRAVLEPDAAAGLGLVWTSVSRADRAAHGLSLDAVESVIDVRAPHRRGRSGHRPQAVRRRAVAGVRPVQGQGRRGPRLLPAGRRRAPQRGRRHAGRQRRGRHRAAARAAGGKQLGRCPGTPGATRPSGLIVVDKPGGLTSHDVVARIRRLAGTRRVGHAGTLDPMATGVLVVGVEKATRLLGHLP